MPKAETQRLRVILEAMRDGVYVADRDYTVIFMNQAMVREFGDGTGEKCFRGIYRRDSICPWCRAEEVYQRGETLQHELSPSFLGKTFDVLEIPLHNADGSVTKLSIYRDITERRQREADLRASAADYRRLFEHVGCGVYVSSKEGKFLDANPALLDMLGYADKEAFLSMDISKGVYLHPEDRRRFQALIERDGHVIDYEVDFKRRDGTAITVLLTSHVRYDPQGKILGYEGIIVDQTQRNQMERKLRQTQAQLLQSEKLAAMGRLTSQIAHELNNPLYGIMNTLELVKTEIPPQSKRRRILDMALSETVRLGDLLRKMLSFSKPDQEQRRPVDVNTILDEIVILHEKQLRENSIRVVTDFQENIAPVMASTNQLRQVFINMFSNARDAMPEGGSLRVKTESDAHRVHVSIADTGIGIAPQDLNKIFDTFFTTKESVKGVGLGLSVCYGFIQDHGGDIQVESKPGKGSTFIVTLPSISPTALN